MKTNQQRMDHGGPDNRERRMDHQTRQVERRIARRMVKVNALLAAAKEKKWNTILPFNGGDAWQCFRHWLRRLLFPALNVVWDLCLWSGPMRVGRTCNKGWGKQTRSIESGDSVNTTASHFGVLWLFSFLQEVVWCGKSAPAASCFLPSRYRYYNTWLRHNKIVPFYILFKSVYNKSIVCCGVNGFFLCFKPCWWILM